MPTITTHAPGTFCWFELHTTDDKAAQRFYGSLFGWSDRPLPIGSDMVYRIQQLSGQDVAAVTKLMPDQLKQGIPPHWMQYVATDNVDATTEKAKSLGASVLAPPMDVMDAGRMAVIRDPQGAVISIWKGKNTPGVGIKGDVGAQVWCELLTRDTAGAQKFYTGLFGWTSKDMSQPGMTYTVFENKGTGIAGMMAIRPDMGPMPPTWMLYFRSANCDATVKKTQELGGKVLVPARDIPTVGRFAVLQDPTGAAFSILQPQM